MLPGRYILSLVSPDGEKGSSEDFKLQQMRDSFSGKSTMLVSLC